MNDHIDENNQTEPVPLPPPPPPNAGAYYSNSQYPTYSPPNESKAVVALVLGILSIITCFPLGVAAIILGRKSREAIRMSNGTLGGDGLAQAGFITGIIGLCIGTFQLLLFFLMFVPMMFWG